MTKTWPQFEAEVFVAHSPVVFFFSSRPLSFAMTFLLELENENKNLTINISFNFYVDIPFNSDYKVAFTIQFKVPVTFQDYISFLISV